MVFRRTDSAFDFSISVHLFHSSSGGDTGCLPGVPPFCQRLIQYCLQSQAHFWVGLAFAFALRHDSLAHLIPSTVGETAEEMTKAASTEGQNVNAAFT